LEEEEKDDDDGGAGAGGAFLVTGGEPFLAEPLPTEGLMFFIPPSLTTDPFLVL